MEASARRAEPTVRRYAHAPIVEAVIDIQTSLPSFISLQTLEKAQVGEEASYPNKRQSYVMQAEFQTMDQNMAANATQRQTGHIFVSRDGRQLYQSRLDGFTFNRLAPYDRWQSFSNEALRLWRTYQRIAQPKSVRRLAVRYINRLDIPDLRCEIQDYFATYPEIAPRLPQLLNRYLVQLQIPLEEHDATVNLTEALVDPTKPETTSIILDIDVFRTVDLPTDSPDFYDILSRSLNELRLAKNLVFEACITDKTRELIG